MYNMSDIPQIDKQPAPCPVCETAVVLGLLTAVCETAGHNKGACYDLLKPLENGSEKPIDTLSKVIVKLTGDGNDPVNEVVDRFNLIMMGATAKAKDELMRLGKIDKDGMPKE